MRFFRFVLLIVVLGAMALGIAYYLAGWTAGPEIAIKQPVRFIGRSTTLDLTVNAPRDQLNALTVHIEQNGRTMPVFALDSQSTGSLQPVGTGEVRLTHAIDRDTVPQLQPGQATIVAVASRPALGGLRTISSRSTRQVRVRFDPPKVAVVSTHHYINQGGSELVIYRVSPPEVDSGVRVGEYTYPGYPASGAGLPHDPALKAAFFALLYNQDKATPIEVFAKDEAGNEARTQFDRQVFPKAFRRSRIDIDDAFISRVVPPIVEHSPELKMQSSSSDASAFVKVNNELRRLNDVEIAALSRKTSTTILWRGPFQQLGNSQVESSFADYRTYFYHGKEVDRQVHLGFDLAVTTNVPIVAANSGKVMYADYLGIYGNTVIIDHGMGVESLYGHLSSFDVTSGQSVDQGQTIGRSGQTGLAGGDHLHFSMIVNGHFVTPTEWWDPHWIEDRIGRKLREAGGATTPPHTR